MTHGRIYGNKVTLLAEGELQRQQDDILGRRRYWIRRAVAQRGEVGTGIRPFISSKHFRRWDALSWRIGLFWKNFPDLLAKPILVIGG